MAAADANLMNLAYDEETTYGVTDSGPPTLVDVRYTGESLSADTDTTVSAEIRSDRQNPDIVRTNFSASGDVNIELSYGAYDDWLEAAFLSSGWSNSGALTTVINAQTTIAAVSGSPDSFTDSGNGFVSGGATQYQWVEVRGFTTNATNNGYFKLLTVAAGTIEVYGFNSLISETAGDSVTITMGSQIVQGVTERSFTIEKEYTDVSNLFEVLTGMEIDGFSGTVTAGAISKASFTWIGQDGASGTSTVGDGSNTSSAANDVFNGIDNVVGVAVNQTSQSVTQISWALTNNLRARQQIGTLGAVSIGLGSIGLTGTLQSFLEDAVVMNLYLNFTEVPVAWAFEDAAGNSYIFDVPSVRFTSGQRVAGGRDQDIIADLGWSAKRNSSEDVTFRIVRFAA